MAEILRLRPAPGAASLTGSLSAQSVLRTAGEIRAWLQSVNPADAHSVLAQAMSDQIIEHWPSERRREAYEIAVRYIEGELQMPQQVSLEFPQ